MNNFVKTRIYQMARSTGTNLTQLHFRILEFTSDYYSKHKVGPMYHVLKRKFGVVKNDLEILFPHGLFSIYTWVGIPIQTPDQICKHIAEVDVMEKREIYFDHNATTYVRDEVNKVLIKHFEGKYGFGNPSSANRLGKEAYDNIYQSRTAIAKIVKCSPEEIIFTGSGSEANNTAIKGIAFNHLETKGHIISSKTEHPAVLETLKWLENIGFEITLLDVNQEGIVDPDDLRKSLKQNTILVAIMAVNNEIGTINPFEEIGKICAEKEIPFMCDAIQAFGKMHIHPKQCGISMMTVSGHKIYAPKGVGILYVDKNISLSPLVHGGGQESGVRAGTENTAYIMALEKASQLMYSEMHNEHERLTELRNYFISRLVSTVPGFKINGSLEKRLPNNLNIGFPDVDSGALQLSLNHIGVFVSSGSACHEGSSEASHVIKALGLDTDKYGTIRFSFGLKNSKEDIDYLFNYLPDILDQLRNLKNPVE